MNKIPNLNPGRFYNRFFGWLFSQRVLGRLLLTAGIMITLLAIIYLRVDLHGKSEWEKYKRQMAAKSETLDWAAYVPAPVPDDENIFKAPKMAEWFGDNPATLVNQPLEHRITNSFAARFSNTKTGMDIESPQEAANYVAWSDAFQDDFDAIAEALKRPSARLVADYSKPDSIILLNVATAGAVVKTLVQRARCHLILGQADKAWQELTLLHEMRRMVEGQGKFMTPEGDWMLREEARYTLQIIAKGLELHAWRDTQLETMQGWLANSDFIALHAEALKCARALLASSLEYGPTEDGNVFKAAFTSSGGGLWHRVKGHPEYLLVLAAPRGLMYERATGLSQNFEKMINAMTPGDGILRPEVVSKAFAQWKKAQEGLPFLLRTQTQVNECEIACALERYRLKRKAYPEALDDLVPQFVNKLPHDLINGRPLTYRRTDNGRFVLYSVGWNETDDGGQDVSRLKHPETFKDGDWAWESAAKLD